MRIDGWYDSKQGAHSDKRYVLRAWNEKEGDNHLSMSQWYTREEMIQLILSVARLLDGDAKEFALCPK